MTHARAPVPSRSQSLLRRCALGLWLCGIGLIGAMEWQRAAFADGAFAPSFISWLWALGTLSTSVIGVVLLVRALRRGAAGHD